MGNFVDRHRRLDHFGLPSPEARTDMRTIQLSSPRTLEIEACGTKHDDVDNNNHINTNTSSIGMAALETGENDATGFPEFVAMGRRKLSLVHPAQMDAVRTERLKSVLQSVLEVGVVRQEVGLLESIVHCLWTTLVMFPVVIAASVLIGLTLVIVSSVEENWRYFACVSCATCFYSFGSYLGFVANAGLRKGIAGAILTSGISFSLEYVNSLFNFPNLHIGGFSGFIVILSTFCGLKFVLPKQNTIITLVVSVICSISSVVCLFYTYYLTSTALTLIQEVLVCGIGYYMVVMFVGRILFADFIQYYIVDCFEESKSQSIFVFSVMAKLSFSFPQVYALLDLDDGFALSLLASNILEIFVVVVNVGIVKSKVASYLKQAASQTQVDLDKNEDGSQAITVKQYLRHWFRSFGDISDTKIALILYGEEIGDRLNSWLACIGFLMYRYVYGVPQDNLVQDMLRCVLVLVVEQVEDIVKARVIIKTIGISFHNIPGTVLPSKIQFIIVVHAAMVFSIVLLGKTLAQAHQ